MAISVASTDAAQATLVVATAANTPATPATGTANPTGTVSPFQAILAGATTRATTALANATNTAPTGPPTSNTTTNNPNTPADSTLIGFLALAAQFQFLTPPTNAAIAQANGIATTAAATSTATTAAATATPGTSRALDLLLNRTGGLAQGRITTPTGNAANLTTATNNLLTATAPGTTAAGTAQSTVAAQTAAAQTAAANALPTLLPTTPAVPTQTPVGAALAVATQGGSPNIPPPAPIISNLTPNVPVPADLSTIAPAINASAATVPASALPAAELGDRPATAGERFAAIANAGAQLAAANPPPSGVFANVLNETATVTGATAARATPATLPTTAASASAGALGALGANAVVGTLVTQPTAPLLTGDTVLISSRTNAEPTSALNVPSVEALASAVPPVLTPSTAADSRSTDTSTTNASAAASALANVQAFHLPTASAPTPISTPSVTASATPAAQVADALVSQANVLERPGSTEFHIRLDPPELGRVQIRLTTSGDEIHGQVLVANDSVKQMLESQMPELRQRLEAAGVNLQQFNIATDAGSGGNRNSYRDATPEFTPSTAAAEAPSAPPRARIGRIETGSLDVTV